MRTKRPERLHESVKGASSRGYQLRWWARLMRFRVEKSIMMLGFMGKLAKNKRHLVETMHKSAELPWKRECGRFSISSATVFSLTSLDATHARGMLANHSKQHSHKNSKSDKERRQAAEESNRSKRRQTHKQVHAV